MIQRTGPANGAISHRQSALISASATRVIHEQNHFRQPNSLFRQLCLFTRWGLFFARWGLFFASIYVRKSPAILFNLGDPSAPLHQSSFHQQKLKLLSLSAQLERTGWQILTAVCSGGTFCFTAPFQVADRRAAMACTGWLHVSHGIESQSPIFYWPQQQAQA